MNPEPTFRGGNPSYKLGPGVFTTEYEGPGVGPHNLEVPCVQCAVTGARSQLTLTGVAACPAGWDELYQGKLASDRTSHYRHYANCVDNAKEPAPSASTAGWCEQ